MATMIMLVMISFNPRPCVRGDSCTQMARGGSGSFNPRPCVRGDLWLIF